MRTVEVYRRIPSADGPAVVVETVLRTSPRIRALDLLASNKRGRVATSVEKMESQVENAIDESPRSQAAAARSRRKRVKKRKFSPGPVHGEDYLKETDSVLKNGYSVPMRINGLAAPKIEPLLPEITESGELPLIGVSEKALAVAETTSNCCNKVHGDEKGVQTVGKREQWVVLDRLPLQQRITHCFVCRLPETPEHPLTRCEVRFQKKTRCSTHFHLDCIREYNAGEYNFDFFRNELGCLEACPLHHCHMCFLERRKSSATSGTLIQCAECYRSFHPECLPCSLDEKLGFMQELNDQNDYVELRQNQCICFTHMEDFDNGKYMKPGPGQHRVPFCVECLERDGDGEEEELVPCDFCFRQYHPKCHRFSSVRGLEASLLGTRGERFCEACILGEVYRPGEYLIAFWQSSFYPCVAVKPDIYPNQCKRRDKFGGRNGDAGFVTVQWLGYNNVFAVIPYRMCMPLFAGSYKLIGKRVSDKKSKLAWREIDNGSGSIPVPLPDPETTLLRKSADYWKIKTSVYHSEEAKCYATTMELEDTKCDCKAEAKNRCGDNDCTTRAVCQECTEACGPTCNNRNISSKHVHGDVQVRDTPGKGQGLFATDRIPRGTFVAEYAGEIISREEQKRRIEHSKKSMNDEQHHYMMVLDRDRVIDCKKRGNMARFINHSCEPNCRVEMVLVPIKKNARTVTFDHRLQVVTIREVKKGDELSFDYQMREYEEGVDIPDCRCSAPSCTGKLGGRPAAEQRKLKKETAKNGSRTKNAKKRKLKPRKKTPSRESSLGSIENQSAQVVSLSNAAPVLPRGPKRVFNGLLTPKIEEPSEETTDVKPEIKTLVPALIPLSILTTTTTTTKYIPQPATAGPGPTLRIRTRALTAVNKAASFSAPSIGNSTLQRTTKHRKRANTLTLNASLQPKEEEVDVKPDVEGLVLLQTSAKRTRGRRSQTVLGEVNEIPTAVV